jgi:hypothetical protein
MPPRKLLKSNGLQLRNAENFICWAALIVQLTILCYMCSEEVNLDGFVFTRGITISSFLAIYSSSLDWTRRLRLERFQQLLPRPEPPEEYCPLYTLVDDAGACRSFGFCFRTMKWVGLRHVLESTSRRSVTLPIASAGGLLFYTEDGHSSEDVFVVNPLTGEQKILGVPTLDNGPPPLWRRCRQTGMIMRMATISLKRMQKMGPLSSLMNLNWTKFPTLVDLNGMKKNPQTMMKKNTMQTTAITRCRVA